MGLRSRGRAPGGRVGCQYLVAVVVRARPEGVRNRGAGHRAGRTARDPQRRMGRRDAVHPGDRQQRSASLQRDIVLRRGPARLLLAADRRLGTAVQAGPVALPVHQCRLRVFVPASVPRRCLSRGVHAAVRPRRDPGRDCVAAQRGALLHGVHAVLVDNGRPNARLVPVGARLSRNPSHGRARRDVLRVRGRGDARALLPAAADSARLCRSRRLFPALLSRAPRDRTGRRRHRRARRLRSRRLLPAGLSFRDVELALPGTTQRARRRRAARDAGANGVAEAPSGGLRDRHPRAQRLRGERRRFVVLPDGGVLRRLAEAGAVVGIAPDSQDAGRRCRSRGTSRSGCCSTGFPRPGRCSLRGSCCCS